ncbi:hypothetical protein BC628DRAFT_1423935 [Trametes gibbosa]|uniref:C2H2-type domain-containing protein n=1 Tax=Trametes gibbosa TaxID=160864 RepID=A0A6G6FQI2_9APHY|nr:hypothetical protein BC628DRAFT_1423935 [Trametes gibbosa]QIE48443.1 hypothetical protein [Trametes gibbosa]
MDPRPSDLLPSSTPDNDSLFDSYIHSSAYIDHSFCSNFSCCGQSIPDLHNLLDHFEEDHVLPLPHDSRPLYSSPLYPAPPHTSYILSYPQPDPPLHPLSHSILAPHRPLGVLPDLSHLLHSPLSPSPSSPSSSFSSPNLAEPLCLPPALLTCHPPRPHSPSARARRRPRFAGKPLGDNVLDNVLTPTTARSDIGPQRSAKSHPRPSPVVRRRHLANPQVHAPAHDSGPRRRDGREKMFKCPHSGCMKSYLNPNGLKYHLEKGTCTNADVCTRASLSAATTAAALALPSTTATPEPPELEDGSPTTEPEPEDDVFDSART